MALKLGELFVDIGADTSGLRRADREIKRTANGMSKSFFSLGRVIAAALTGVAVKSTILLADKMNMLDQQLKNVVKNAASFKKIRDGVRGIAAETGNSIESVTRLTQALIIAGESIGATDDQIIEMTSNLNKLGVIGGSSAEAMGNALRQFGQAMAGGIVRAEEFNSIVENTPLIAKAIADGMGVTTGELRKMVIEGKVLSEEVFRALQSQTDGINAKFAAMPLTVERASGMIANSFATAMQELDAGFKTTEQIAEAMKDLSDFIGEDLVPGIDLIVDGFLEYLDILDMSTAATQDLANDTFDLGASWGLVKKKAEDFGFVMQNFPAIVRNVTTIMLGEWDKHWAKTEMSFSRFTLFISSALENAFTSMVPRVTAIFNKMIASIANDFSKLVSLFGFDITDDISESLQNLSDEFALASQSITAEEELQQEIRDAIYQAEIDAINAKFDAVVAATDGIILAGIKDTEALQLQARERTKIRQRERKERRRGDVEVQDSAKKTAKILEKTNAEKLKDIKAFGQASNTLAQAGILSSRANAAVQIGVSAATAVAKTAELGFPQALPFIAQALATIANARSMLSSSGRQHGGTASGGLPIPINEGGPEMFTNNAGRQFLLPDKSGNITPLGQGGSGSSGLSVIINNNVPNVEITPTMMSDGQIMIEIDRAMESAIDTVNSSLASGRGPTFDALRSGSTISRSI